MYGKIFESIYDGTLVEDWRALITFQQFIVLCDADGMVDMTPSAISRRTGIPIEHIKAGIEILEKEDLYSRTADQKGRRIERLDDHRPWGWHIVNHEKYKQIRSAEDRREYMQKYMADRREQEKLNDESCKQKKLTDVNSKQVLTPLANTNTYTYTNTYKPNRSVFPENLNIEAWHNYLEYRKQSKSKKLKPKSEDLLMKWLIEQGDQKQQRKIIEQTIRNGWTGLFELKGEDSGTHKKSRAQRVNDKYDELANEAVQREGSPGYLDNSDI